MLIKYSVHFLHVHYCYLNQYHLIFLKFCFSSNTKHAFTVHSLIFHVSHIHTDMPTSHIICISSDFLSYLVSADYFLRFKYNFLTVTRACLKKAFRELRVPVCGKFYPNEGGVAGYGNRIRVKYTAKWGLQIAEMIFQTRSSTLNIK